MGSFVFSLEIAGFLPLTIINSERMRPLAFHCQTRAGEKKESWASVQPEHPPASACALAGIEHVIIWSINPPRRSPLPRVDVDVGDTNHAPAQVEPRWTRCENRCFQDAYSRRPVSAACTSSWPGAGYEMSARRRSGSWPQYGGESSQIVPPHQHSPCHWQWL